MLSKKLPVHGMTLSRLASYFSRGHVAACLSARSAGLLSLQGKSAYCRFVRRHGSSQVVVVTSGKGEESPYLAKVVVNDRHRLQADEPTSVGGKDLGPSPYDLLLSALGSCTVMTLQMYADRKQLPLTNVSVRLTHNKVHKKDCEECDTVDHNKGTTSPLFDRIERIIMVEGSNLTDKDRMRLLEIANKCPVHRTLEHGQVVVVSSLAEK
jgi:uncharacterized OsmC-like protein